MNRVRKPKPPTLIEEARAFDGDLMVAKALITRLADRVSTANGLIDGYALNVRSTPERLRTALRALQDDSAARFPRWRRRRL